MASFFDKLVIAWRQLMLELFGEEYWSDFSYREALARGKLWPILATRKLLSPIKLITALVNSIILVLTTSVNHFRLKYVMPFFAENAQLFRDPNPPLRSILVFMMKVILGLCLFTVPFVFFPIVSLLALSTPLIANFLKIVACPVNTIVRPIASYLGVSPILLSAVLATLTAASAFLVFNFISFSGLSVLLLPAYLILNTYQIIGYLQLTKKLYDMNPGVGMVQGIITGLTLPTTIISIVAALLAPGAISLVTLAYCFVNAVLVYQANNGVKHLKQSVADRTEVLPLPEEEVPETIQIATLQGLKTVQQSHRFFNTKKSAEYIPQEKRTVLQQTASFFGGGDRLWEAAQPLVPRAAALA